MEIILFELPVGFQFVDGGIVYEVRQGSSCEGCSFFIKEENHCVASMGKGGLCQATFRTDGKFVNFVEIGEVK